MHSIRSIPALSLSAFFLALCFTPLPLPAQAPAEHAPTRSDAEALLRRWKQTNLIEDTAFAPYTPLGSKALPLFAPFLNDKELSPFAEWAMQKIDAAAATPYLLKLLPQKDGSFQAQTLRAANRALLEYGWHERAGKPAPKPGEAPPRFPRNTQPYPYTKEMHDAAVAIVTDKIQTGPETLALLTIGLTGSRKDFPLLRKFAAQPPGRNYESGEHYFALSALARLGDKAALDEIAAELEKPIKTKPADPYSTESGKTIQPQTGEIVVTPEEAQRLRSVLEMAAFSMNPRFVPLLARHLDDPGSQSYGDYHDPDPKHGAIEALGKIVAGTENWLPIAHWKAWWTNHAAEYTKPASAR